MWQQKSRIPIIAYILTLLLVTNSNVVAQKPEKNVATEFEAEFDAFFNETKTKFQQFKDSTDLEYARFMRKTWAEFQLMEQATTPLKPKPTVPPIAPKPTPDVPKPTPIAPKPTPDVPKPTPDVPKPTPDVPKPTPDVPKPTPDVPKPTPDVPKPPKNNTLDLMYYGLPLPIQYDPKFQMTLTQPLSEGIPNAWIAMSEGDYTPIVAQLQHTMAATKLNDWGYVMWAYKFAQTRFPNDHNRQMLTACFLLTKAGFATKVGYAPTGDMVLLLRCDHVLYSRNYFMLNGGNYYIFDFGKNVQLKNMRTYDAPEPVNARPFNFVCTQRPNMGEKHNIIRTVKFPYNGQTYEVTMTYNKGLMDFYTDHPFTELNITIGGQLSSPAYDAAKKQLAPLLKDKNDFEALNLLLAFVQLGFEYQVDEQQFGKERYLFPEEVLFYPYSDCEDRSALFAALVRDLTGKEVVGLLFSDHAATAVLWEGEEVPGSFLTFEGKKYLLCDPTYMGATAGQMTDKYLNESPKVLKL
jgi:hypothetical protein